MRELFGLENRVRGMRSRLDAATRRRNAQQTKLDQLTQQSAELDAELKRLKAHAATLESEAQAADQRVTELRDRMNSVTSNKEYSALLVEVNNLKVEKGKAEDEALEQMGKIDEMQGRADELSEKLAQQKKVVETSSEEVEAAREEVGDQLDTATTERDTAASALPDDVVTMFHKLADQYDGEAVATIEEQNRRRMEYICGGCYIQLPVESVNALMSKPDEVTICPACRRILLIDAELKTALAPK